MKSDSPERRPGEAQLGDMLLHLALAALLDITALREWYLRNACCRFEYATSPRSNTLKQHGYVDLHVGNAHTKVT